MAPKGQTERAAVRRVKSLDLRIEGKSYRAIAALLNVDAKTAWKDVKDSLEELDDIAHEKAEHLRRIELERLDALTEVIWPQAMEGGKDGKPNLFAVDRLLSIMAQRSKLLGLDAPIKQESTGSQEIVVRYVDDLSKDDG